MAKIYVLLAEGFELMETTVPIDILKRAGIKVTTLSLNKTPSVNSAQNIPIIADEIFKDYKDADGIFLAGGYSNYENLFRSDEAFRMIDFYLKNNKFIFAISGAPYSLAKHNLINNRTISVHKTYEEKAKEFCNISSLPITLDKNLITCKSTGFVQDLAFKIVKILAPNKLEKVKKGLGIL
ncbi:DJ-1/PfpI family protein [Fusobacterium sp.]|uniref:DJ-1/PfpI family protein n=1 Tax=Fusobacterium sp. TaxID=68766 RepID=UPI0026025A13|nr:DJ-1/PfpI family protein [Fusobacterium sp.]